MTAPSRPAPLRATCAASLFAVIVLALACGGCGFHLRGEAARAVLPPVDLRIDRARTELAVAVAEALRDADVSTVGGTATSGGATAPAWQVHVTDQEEDRRSRTLTRGIQVAEYELTVALEFEVRDTQGRALHPSQRLSASRVYAREQENLLTNEAEEDILWAELRRDVAAQLATAVATQLDAAARTGAAGRH